MIINCDYCGTSIDTQKQKVCPICGAAYNDDEEYIQNKKRQDELKELKLKQLKDNQKHQEKIKEIDIERQKLDIENLKIYNKRQQENEKYRNKTSKLGMALLYAILIPIICGILCCVISVIVAISTDPTTNVNTETKIETETQIEIKETPVFGGFNETLKTSTYSVTITELKTADSPWHWNPDDGYMYIALYFEVENLTDDEILSDEAIYCTVNDILVEKFNYSNDKYIKVQTIPAGMKIAGYACFEVPINSEQFTVKYGEYLTFTIPNTLK